MSLHSCAANPIWKTLRLGHTGAVPAIHSPVLEPGGISWWHPRAKNGCAMGDLIVSPTGKRNQPELSSLTPAPLFQSRRDMIYERCQTAVGTHLAYVRAGVVVLTAHAFLDPTYTSPFTSGVSEQHGILSYLYASSCRNFIRARLALMAYNPYASIGSRDSQRVLPGYPEAEAGCERDAGAQENGRVLSSASRLFGSSEQYGARLDEWRPWGVRRTNVGLRSSDYDGRTPSLHVLFIERLEEWSERSNVDGYHPRDSGKQDIGSSQGGEPRTSMAFLDTSGVPRRWNRITYAFIG
ncbi:hypothetical protein LXA43DRAFT_1063040 [Ganoderma leucocontextum]|nr:hypothetical protein LXA43DRAFT_1063040 [Ganoderma leucocontextum]